MTDDYQLRKELDNYKWLFDELTKELERQGVVDISGLLNRFYDQSEIDAVSNKLTTDLDNLDVSLTTLKTNLVAFNQSLINYNGDTETLATDLSTLSTNLDAFLGDVSTLATDLSGLSDSLDGLGTDLSTLDSTVSGLSTTIGDNNSGLVKELNDLSSSVDGLDSDLDSLDSTVSGLSTTIGDNNSGLVKGLNDLSSSVDGLDSDLSRLDGDLSSLSGEMTTARGTFNNLGARLSDLDTDLSGLDGALSQLSGELTQTSSSLNDVKGDLYDANGDLLITASDLSSLSSRLSNFITDLGTLSDYIVDFEGGLEELQDDLEEDGIDLSTFSITNNIVKLFGIIGTVKSDVSDVQSNVEVVQTDIYGNPNDATDGGLIGTIMGNYELSSETPTYTNTVSSDTVVNQTLSGNYRIQISGNGTTIYIRSATDSRNLIRFRIYNNVIQLSVRIDNVYALSNAVMTNNHIDVLGKKIVYDNKVYDISPTTIDPTNLYQINGDVSVYGLTGAYGIISQINKAQDNIDTINTTSIPAVTTNINTVKSDLYGGTSSNPNSASSPSSNSVKGLLNTAVNTTIPSLDTAIGIVEGDVGDVQTDLYGTGTASSPQTGSIKANLTDVRNTVGDSNRGLVKDLNTASSNISNVKTDLYGTGNASNPQTGSVKANVNAVKTTVGDSNSGLVKDLNTASSNISTVQTDMYGSNKDPSNPQTGSVMSNIDVVQTDIYGNPNDANDGGLIGTILGNYELTSETPIYSNTVSSDTQVNFNLGSSYRVQITGNGTAIYIRKSNDSRNLIRFRIYNNVVQLSVRVDNTYVLSNEVMKNNYIDVLGNKIVYDNKAYDISNTAIDPTNLYQINGDVSVYGLTGGYGIISQINTVQDDIIVVQDDTLELQGQIYGEDGTGTYDVNNPSSASLLGTIGDTNTQGTVLYNINEVQGDVSDIQGEIGDVDTDWQGDLQTQINDVIITLLSMIPVAHTVNTLSDVSTMEIGRRGYIAPFGYPYKYIYCKDTEKYYEYIDLGDEDYEWYESENVVRHAFLNSNIYQLISGFFSDVDHTHSTWNSMTLSPYATLYVNESLHLCRLHFDRTFNGASADTFYTWSDETVPTTYIPQIYRPLVQSHGSINHTGVLYVKADGSYGGKFAVSWSNSARHCIGDCWWNYEFIPTE